MIDYIGRFVSTVSNALEFNQATLSGCIDVIVVQHDDGTFMCTPFNVRFGKLKLLRSREKKISIFVNDVEAPFKMRLGIAGDGYFEEQPSLCGVIKDSETEIKMPSSMEKETEPSETEEGVEKTKSDSKWSKLWRKAPEDAVQIEKEKEKEMKDASKKLLGSKLSKKMDDEKEIERIMNPEIDEQMSRKECLKRKIKDKLKESEKENEAPQEPNIEKKQEKQKIVKGGEVTKIAHDENQQQQQEHHEEIHEEDDETAEKKGLFRSLLDHLKNHNPFHKVTAKVDNRIIHLPSLHDDESLKDANLKELHESETFVDTLECLDFHTGEEKHEKEKAAHEDTQLRLELSLCGAAVYGKPKEDLNEIFEEYRVPYNDFIENAYKILSDPNLMVKMGNNLYDWKVACPLIISLVGYKKLIPEDTLHDMASKEAMPSSGHWKNWFKFLKRKSSKKLEEGMKEDEMINRERKELAEQFEETDKPIEESLKVKEATEKPKTATAKPEPQTEKPITEIIKPVETQKPKAESSKEMKKPDIIEKLVEEIENKVKAEVKPEIEAVKHEENQKPSEIPLKTASDDTKKEMEKILIEEEKLHHQAENAPVSEEKPPMITENQIIKECMQQEKVLEKLEGKKVEKRRVWRTLRPTSDMLKSMNLKPGCNVVVYKVDGSKKEKSLTANIYLWPANAKIILSDIDGTITKSDGLGQLMPVLGRDWSQPGVCKLYNSIRKNGYQIMYLTARAIGQSQLTKNFLNTLVQEGYNLPPGPVILSPDLLVPAFKREVIYRKPEVFKIAYLRDLRSIFPPSHNPFYAGFGNRETDAIAYQAVGVYSGKIFTINPVGCIRVLNATYAKSYSLINGLANEMFPGIEADDKYQTSEEYNEVNYFKINYENVVEDFDVNELVEKIDKDSKAAKSAKVGK